MGVPGKGLIDGLKVTAKTLARRAVTEQYPDVKPELPPRTRGVIALLEENCTSCMLCARECPSWCIYIDSHTETAPSVGEQARERSRNVLDRFAIDFSLCMYCGICIEACPFDALFWSPEFEYAETELRNLTHEKDRLRDWMWTVPAPQPIDPGPTATESLPQPSADQPTHGASTPSGAPTATTTPGPTTDRAPGRAPGARPAPGSGTAGAEPGAGAAEPGTGAAETEAGAAPAPAPGAAQPEATPGDSPRPPEGQE